MKMERWGIKNLLERPMSPADKAYYDFKTKAISRIAILRLMVEILVFNGQEDLLESLPLEKAWDEYVKREETRRKFCDLADEMAEEVYREFVGGEADEQSES